MRKKIYLLCIMLALCPIDDTLGNIIGSYSILNYLMFIYIPIQILELIKGKIKINKIKLKNIVPFLCYLLLLMASTLWAKYDYNTSWYLTTIIGLIVTVIFALIDDYSEKEITYIKKFIIFGALFIIILVLFNFDFNNNTDRMFLTISRYMDPNYFSISLCLSTAVCCEKINNNKKYFLLLAGIFLVVILTGSRGGLLSNSFVLVYFYLKSKNSFKQKIKNIFLIILLVIFMYVVAVSFLPDWAINRYNIDTMFLDKGSGRLEIWEAGLKYYKNQNTFNTLFGIGLGQFKYAINSIWGYPKAAHNMFILTLVENGIFGLTLLIKILTESFKKCKKTVFSTSILLAILIGSMTVDMYTAKAFWFTIMFIFMVDNSHFYNLNLEKEKKQ